MYCAKCGTLISEGKYFCSNCGHLNTPASTPDADPAGETIATPLYIPVEPPATQPIPVAELAEPVAAAPIFPATPDPAPVESTPQPAPAVQPIPAPKPVQESTPLPAPVQTPAAPPAPAPALATPPNPPKPQGFWVPIILYFVIGLVVSLALNKNDSVLLAKYAFSYQLLAQFKLIDSLSFLALVAFGPLLALLFSKLKKPVVFLIIGAVIAVAGLVGMGVSADMYIYHYSSLAILASVPFLLAYTGANRWTNHALRLGSALVGVIASVVLVRLLGKVILPVYIYPAFAGLALLLLLLLVVTAKYSADKVFGKVSIKDVGITGLHLIMIFYIADLLNSLLSYFSIFS